MRPNSKQPLLYSVFVIIACLMPLSAQGADFVIKDGEKITTPQVLSDNETVTIQSGGVLATSDIAIEALGNDIILTLDGAISTTGEGAHAIASIGDDARITLSGSIKTTGLNAIGIVSTGNGANITQSGSLETTGDFAIGIVSTGNGANITQSGSLETTGDNAHAIASTGTGANITQSGSIQVTGKDAVGIFFTGGSNSTVTVSGDVFATGEATYAIRGENNQTLNLLPGFRILGALDLGDATVNITGGNTASSTLTFENVDTIKSINLRGAAPAVRSDDMVTVIDPTGYAATSATLGLTTLGIHTAVNQQLARTPTSIEIAANGSAAWGRAFGRRTSRGDDGAALAYDSDSFGFIGGYEGAFDDHRVGVFAGFSQTNIETDITSIDIDTDSYFIGAYGQRVMNRWSLTAAMTAGFETHDAARTVLDNLNGLETAKSDYNSVYISPSLTLQGNYEGPGGIQLRPSAQLIYTYGRYQDYRETGSTLSNLAVDDRHVSVANGRLQLAVTRTFDAVDGGRSEIGLRGGLNVRHHGSDRVDVDFNGAPLTIDRAGERTVLGGYVGAHVTAAVNDRLSLVADVEYDQASGDEKSFSVNVRASLSF